MKVYFNTIPNEIKNNATEMRKYKEYICCGITDIKFLKDELQHILQSHKNVNNTVKYRKLNNNNTYKLMIEYWI